MTTTVTRIDEEEQKKFKSPLGDLSYLYKTKEASKGSILDNPSDGLLELYPAGGTYRAASGHMRQEFYRVIHEAAVKLGTEAGNYPFGLHDHEVSLIREPTNQHDQYAVKIVFECDPKLLPYSSLTPFPWDLGYVPRKISEKIFKNRDMITGGKILKTRQNVYKKYYMAKVVFSYRTDVDHFYDPAASGVFLNEEAEDRFSALVLED